MPIYKLSKTALSPLPQATFSKLGILERENLQQVIKEQIQAVSPETLIIAEEFSEWEDSRRRIDLLGIDKTGNLIVIELKRTTDGGHMDLQAIRYAAMVSALTFDRVVEIFQDYLDKNQKEGDAEKTLLQHLDWSDETDGEIGQQTRIVLVSADFNQEITTTVLWLNEQGLDISCVRMQAYRNEAEVLVDIQQIIPLPEAADYMVRIREKKLEKKIGGGSSRERFKYEVTHREKTFSNLVKRRAILKVVSCILEEGASPDELQDLMSRPRFYTVPGEFSNEKDFLRAASEASQQPDGKTFDARRWFTKPEDLIFHNGVTYAFSDQWGKNTEDTMRQLIAKFGKGEISFRRI
ncbi:hypothetical protein [Roseibacillus persicicus]|uniref:hypothetical protein n=1 Tax=Roseibacillus persicicus TaxID=454148 RepID=UPI00280F9050|nr:hypothetical protein [Roseibacillus persicicus]MDQ8189125.1 hypothetical protein [Roseibacillus persicicus]